MQGTSAHELDRRRFMTRASVAAGTAWAVPLLISSTPAGAAPIQSPPPPNTTPPTSGFLPADTTAPSKFLAADTTPGSGSDPSAQVGAARVERDPGPHPVSRPADLARTGADLDRLTEVGLGTLAAGVGLRVWSSRLDRDPAGAIDARDGGGHRA